MLMNPKHEQFAREFIIDLNAAQAARRAGYSSGTGWRLVRRAEVRQRIDQLMVERAQRCAVSADRVVHELAKLAFVTPSRVIDGQTMGLRPDAMDDDLAAVSGVKVKYAPRRAGEEAHEPPVPVEQEVKLYDKLKALELLGRHVGMFAPQAGPGEGPGGLQLIFTGEEALTPVEASDGQPSRSAAAPAEEDAPAGEGDGHDPA